MVVLLSVAQALALWTNIRRYVTGDDSWSLNLDIGVEWWWPSGPGPTLTFVVGAVAFTALLVCVWWGNLRPARPVVGDATPAAVSEAEAASTEQS